jgi:ubiquinone/menaquinone biosynthesis C-methylase UbiE
MTDFEKVKSFYIEKDEWSRFDTPAGKLEFDLTLPIITSHLQQKVEILDLGGGPGRYTIELAKLGHTLHLADLSQRNLDTAKKKFAEFGIDNVKSITQINAVNLSIYANDSFDAVLLLGPLYHLTDETERLACIKEVKRVLKPNGLIFAAFIPYLSGAIGVVGRMFLTPDQVNTETLNRVFEQGIFNNLKNTGFQEGYYPTSDEVVSLFSSNGFSKILLRSVRGWGSGTEEQIYKLKDENFEMHKTVIDLINKTATDPSIIEMCWHAIYIGRKQ